MENPGIQSDIAELKSARSQLKVWQGGLVIVLAVFLIICVLVLKSTVDRLIGGDAQRKELASALGVEVQKTVVPKIQEVGTEVVKTVDFQGQMKKLNDAAPKVGEVAMKEAGQLATDLPVDGQKILDDKFKAALERQSDALKKEFPGITDEQLKDLMSNLTVEATDQIFSVTNPLFSKHVDAMNDIMADTEKIRSSEGEGANSENLPTWDVAFLIMDIMHNDMAQANAEMKAATTPPVIKPTTKATPKSGKGKK